MNRAPSDAPARLRSGGRCYHNRPTHLHVDQPGHSLGVRFIIRIKPHGDPVVNQRGLCAHAITQSHGDETREEMLRGQHAPRKHTP